MTDGAGALQDAGQSAADAPLARPPRAGPRTEWLSRFAWIIGALACLVLSLHVLSKARYSGSDSWFPMEKALGFLHGPHEGLVYQTLFFSDHVKFQYPLTSLLPLDVLDWLGVNRAPQLNAINAVVLIATGIGFALFSARLLGPIRLAGVRLPTAALAFLAALSYVPIHLSFVLGQLQTVLDLLFVLACLALLYDRRVFAGCMIGAAALVKPQFVLLGLLAIWRKDWRFVAGFISVTSLCLLLSVMLYGWRNELDYLPVLTFLAHHGEWEHMNQSVNGVLVRFLYHGPSLDLDPRGAILQSQFPPYIPAVYYATLLSSLAMMAVPFLTSAKPDDVLSRLLQFCAAALLFTMASPVAWTHHYGILLPAYLIAFKAIWQRLAIGTGWPSLVLLGISFLMTGLALGRPASALGRPVSPTIPDLNILQSHVFIGACLFVGVLLAEQRFRYGTWARVVSPTMPPVTKRAAELAA